MISYQNSMPWMNLVQMPESLLEPECSCIAYICRGFQLMETRREELSNSGVGEGEQSLHAEEDLHVNFIHQPRFRWHLNVYDQHQQQ